MRLGDGAVRRLRTLDPAEPLDDLEWLDDAVGRARVVAIGESAHYNAESYQLRHRLLRYLVERHGFGAYAMESGFTEGWLTDRWVRGGEEPLGHIMADGMTSLMGPWTQMRAHLEWMRQYDRPLRFYGIDLGGSNASLVPGLDAVIAYLTTADPEFDVDPGIRETAAICGPPSAFSAMAARVAYGSLTSAARDALTAGLADLTARMTGRRLDLIGQSTVDDYERALRSLRNTVTLDGATRAMVRGDLASVMCQRDAAMADTVEWILRREDRIVLAAHNAHIQRWPATLPGVPPATPMGMHLADRLGEEYLVIATTTGTGRTLAAGPDFYAGKLFTDLPAPEPDSLDALMDACGGLVASDLRRLTPADVDVVQGTKRQRYGHFYADISPLDAYDVLIHLPHVTPADPDADALAESPQDVREAFARWAADAC